LAHLGVARANALQARTSHGADADAARVRALAAYKDFLTLWKDADSELLVLIASNAEYAKLQWFLLKFCDQVLSTPDKSGNRVRREKVVVHSGSNPPGNWFAPPGSNQSSSGGNETAEASGAECR